MQIKRIATKDLKQEEGAADLVRSEDMRVYLDLAMAELRGKGIDDATAKIRSLPLQKRYLWRVVSALKWALSDCDADNALADCTTMSSADLATLKELLRLRPAQMCILLKAIFGEQEMVRMVTQAVALARQI